jgi:MFS family permease
VPDSQPEAVIAARSRDARLLFAARGVRTFAFGWLSVVLALTLARLGLSTPSIGGVFTATMIEDAVLTILLSRLATRMGSARIMMWTAPLLTLGGVLLAVSEDPRVLIAAAVLGTLSPNGLEAGPFSPLEQALLADAIEAPSRTRVFGWYNIFGFLPAALGSLAAGAWLSLARRAGAHDLSAYRVMLWAYAAAGVVLCLLYARLAGRRPGPTMQPPRAKAVRVRSSRRVVLELSALQGLDALAGGFIMQGLLAYWFHVRFGVGPDVLGVLFFATNLLSAFSFLAASRVAERAGLLNTMVFTHLPSNLLLLLIPLMPSFPLAAAVLLARHVLSQMDVPTRQAYTMALVAADERPAAAGLIASVRAVGQACAPALSGITLRATGSGLPFVLAGALKIVYDLGLYVRFRNVPLEHERGE